MIHRYRFRSYKDLAIVALLGLLACGAVVTLTVSTLRNNGETTARMATDAEAQADDSTTAPSTTSAKTTTTTTTTTTTPPRLTQVIVGDDRFDVSLSPFGWVIPEPELGGTSLGADLEALVPFVEPNDGPFGINIDDEFLVEHAGAQWLSEEDGTPVIDRIDAADRCLNILTPIILRRSFVSCPTRVQGERWGYAGSVDDAPAVNIAANSAEGVIIEHNTITCSGFDEDICSRSIRIGARGAVVRFNDLSHARGAVALFHEATFVFNHLHNFSFGFDPTRANSDTDRVTHNNSVNNLGYQNVLVVGNFIDATYGRVSLEPENYLNPHFRDLYLDGIVRVGDPINGFAFTNYLINGNGDGAVYSRNFVRGVGRPFRCNASSSHDDSVCAEDFSFNVFDDLRIEGFNSESPFDDEDGFGFIGGECNFRIEEDVMTPLALPGETPDQDCELRLELSPDEQAVFSSDVSLTRFLIQ